MYKFFTVGDVNYLHRTYPTFMSGIVHTGGKSPWSWLSDIQTCRTTLALAYILYYLTATWSQLQMKGRSPRGE